MSLVVATSPKKASMYNCSSDDEISNPDDEFGVSTNLPSQDLKDLWSDLVFEDQLKKELLNIINTLQFVGEANLDNTKCGANNLILLHGPPGTGKTSLCKALAQQATVNLIEKKYYKEGILVEVNASSLFSKYFGETGKQVHNLFRKIDELIMDPKTMVFVLIDEIESVTSARKNSSGGGECTDSILAVNELLTEMDRMKNHKNVLFLTTSNITDLIDNAFLSRADITQYIGLPTLNAVNSIYRSMLEELQNKGVIKNLSLDNNNNGTNEMSDSDIIFHMANQSLMAGFSGRTLRKIAFIALSYTSLQYGMEKTEFFKFMKKAIRKVSKDVDNLSFLGNHV